MCICDQCHGGPLSYLISNPSLWTFDIFDSLSIFLVLWHLWFLVHICDPLTSLIPYPSLWSFHINEKNIKKYPPFSLMSTQIGSPYHWDLLHFHLLSLLQLLSCSPSFNFSPPLTSMEKGPSDSISPLSFVLSKSHITLSRCQMWWTNLFFPCLI